MASGATKEGSPAGFQGSGPAGGKAFRGGSSRGGGNSSNRGSTSGQSGGGAGQQASRDRYHPSRESVSSNAEDGPSRGGGSRMGNNTLNNFPDSHQVFVGNLPHQCQESDLEELFSKFGKVCNFQF